MLSVLVPVYNFDIRKLTADLHQQCLAANIPFEIVLIDDASARAFRQLNRETANHQGVRYTELSNNVGRAKIRNILLEEAKFPNLLFIDCDSALPDDKFIARYLPFIDREIIVFGGRVYEPQPPSDSKLYLHWYYGTRREVIDTPERQRIPNQSFMTNNFFIHKSIFRLIRFNEVIRGYGHEDTLFGYELKKNHLTITHIDNPVVHIGLETSAELLRKSRNSIRNLRRILNENGEYAGMAEDITLLHSYLKARRFKADRLITYFYRKYNHLIEANLTGKKPRLLLFDLYKLGYLCSIKA